MKIRQKTKRLRPNKRLKKDDLFYPAKSFNITIAQQQFIDSQGTRYMGFVEAAYFRKLIDIAIKSIKQGQSKEESASDTLLPFNPPDAPTPVVPLPDFSSLTHSLSEVVAAQTQRLIDTQTIALDRMAKTGNGGALSSPLLERIASQTDTIVQLTKQNQTLVNLLVQVLGTSNVSSEMLTSLLAANKLDEEIKAAQQRAMKQTQAMYKKAKGE